MNFQLKLVWKYYALFLLHCIWPPGTEAYCQINLTDSVQVGITRHYWVNYTVGSKYQWSIDGNLFEEKAERISICWQQVGVFNLEVREINMNGCAGAPSALSVVVSNELADGSSLPFILPNAFTPNGDGLNDEFHPVILVNSFNIDDYCMMIFNKRGQLLFESSDIRKGWDGNFNLQRSPTGIYLVKVHYSPAGSSAKRVMHSRVVLLR